MFDLAPQGLERGLEWRHLRETRAAVAPHGVRQGSMGDADVAGIGREHAATMQPPT
jgi:hypothetical protein